jgi:hypothetical protein
MTLTELTTQQSRQAHTDKVQAILDAQRDSNAAIRDIHRRRALYGDHNPTRPLTKADIREVKREQLRHRWLHFKEVHMQAFITGFIGMAVVRLLIWAINKGKQWPYGK